MVTGRPAVRNEEIAEVAAANPDVLIPFASVDPNKGARALEEAKRLIRDYGVKGFKLHPNIQGFYPNDRSVYPFYEVVAEAGLPALVHTGHSGMGSGLPSGGGIRWRTSARAPSAGDLCPRRPRSRRRGPEAARAGRRA